MPSTNHLNGSRQEKAAWRNLLKWLQLVVKPGDVTEVFVKELKHDDLEIRQSYVGFYDADHLLDLAKDAVECSGKSTGVYYRMNPVDSALQARASNRLKLTRYAQSATAENITHRRLLMIDVDPIRPGGISANKIERSAAKMVAEAIREFLSQESWPQPALVDTGNGYSLFFGLDLPNDEGGIVRRVLQGLDSRFGNDEARVDVSVHDPARLARLPGTKNCKGDEVGDRRHRHCRVIRWPNARLAAVSREQLDQIAAPVLPRNPVSFQQTANDDSVISRARAYVSKMPNAIAGNRGHDALFAVACRLVVDFALSREIALPLLVEYNRRCEPPWTNADLERKLDEASVVSHCKPRGQATGDVVVSNPPLEGSDFYGYIPDFADADAASILGDFDIYNTTENDGYFLKMYLVWRLQRSNVLIPDIWLRQWRWGGHWPKNWRQALKKKLGVSRWMDENHSVSVCTKSRCLLHGFESGHRHVSFDREWKWGLLEAFAQPAAAEGHRIFHLNDTQKCWSQEKSILRKQARLIRAYWPGLIFGSSPRVGWNPGQQRLLQGIVYELTRPIGQKYGQQAITKGKVVTAGNGKHSVLCPLLDKNKKYVVFGGNGRRHGRGYQLVGRTSKGWLHRAGFPEAPKRGSSVRFKAVAMLLANLEVLARDLELVVAGYHAKRREWKGIADLQDCLRTGNGQDWLEECSVRIYAPHNWQLLWRYFFSKRMCFRWIPGAIDDNGPFDEVPGEEPTHPSLTRQAVAQWLESKGWTQSDLAAILGCSRRRISRHLTGARWTATFVQEVEALMSQQNGTP